MRMSAPVELGGKTDVGTATPALYKEFHHVEMWVGNAKQTATYFIARMGFQPVAYRGLETGNRDVVTHVVQQGKVRFAFSSALNPGNDAMGDHHKKHGDGVKDVAILVSDCRKVYEMVVAAGGKSVQAPHEVEDEHGKVLMATVETYGDTVHTFIEMGDYAGPFLPGFRAVTEEDPLAAAFPSPKLEFIDHVVGNQPDQEMEAVCDWYERVMGFRRFWSVDDSQVTTEFSSLRSVVMTDPSESVKMPINEPANGKRKSQIQEFVDFYGGPGVQHMALRSFDIIHSVKALKTRGVQFLKVPETYYEDLRRRLGDAGQGIKEDLDVIQALNILVDFDQDGCNPNPKP